MTLYRAFAIDVRTRLALPGAWAAPAAPSARATANDATEIVTGPLPPWPGTGPGGWEGVNDGRRLEVQVSPGGEHRFVYDERPVFHLSADHRTLTAASSETSDVSWWRILMDSVLFTVSLLRGNEALHAAACAGAGDAIAIVAGTGGGKSTLLGELLSRGLELVTDDVLFLEAGSGPAEVTAHPGPPLMTLPRAARTELLAPLGAVGDEIWGARPASTAAVALRHVVVLERRPGVGTALRPLAMPLAALVGNLLAFPAAAEREAARFSLAGAVVSAAEIWQLVSDVSTPPAALADLILQRLR